MNKIEYWFLDAAVRLKLPFHWLSASNVDELLNRPHHQHSGPELLTVLERLFARGDLFLDFEGDPFVGAHGLEYLTGYCCFAGERFVYTQLWALDHAAEKRALVDFLEFVRRRLAEHPDLRVYHFGAYEVAALRRLCSRHDTHGDVLDLLLRGERFVDLHRVVRESLRIGIESYGLKELERVIGFERQLDLRTAGVARRRARAASETERAVPRARSARRPGRRHERAGADPRGRRLRYARPRAPRMRAVTSPIVPTPSIRSTGVPRPS